MITCVYVLRRSGIGVQVSTPLFLFLGGAEGWQGRVRGQEQMTADAQEEAYCKTEKSRSEARASSEASV